jgi:hypothetical protein
MVHLDPSFNCFAYAVALMYRGMSTVDAPKP